MKYPVLYFILALVYSSLASYHHNENLPRGMIENTINTTLNKIKEKLPELIVIDSVPLDFGHKAPLSGGLNISKLTIIGVKDFLATEIKVEVIKQDLHIKLVVSEITAQFKYWADTVLLDLVPFYGQGRMIVSLDDIEVTVDAAAELTEGPKIRDIWISVTLSEAVFHLDGLLDNPEYSALVSNVLNDNFAEFINANPDVISSIISPIAQAIVNQYLHQKEAVVRGVNVVVKK